MAFNMQTLARTGFLFIGKSSTQFTGTTVRANMLNPQLQTRSLIAADRFFTDKGHPLQLITPMMDLASATKDFGGEVNYPENAAPEVSKFVIDIVGGIDNIASGVLDLRKDPGIQVSGMLREHYGSQGPIIANCILGPFSLAARLAKETDLMMMACEDPDRVLALVEKATTYLIEQANATLAVCGKGTGVMVCEPTAGMLSGIFAGMYSNYFVKRIMGAVEGAGGVPMYHNCGNSVPGFADTLNDIGANVVHIGNGSNNSVNIAGVATSIADGIGLSGNLDPALFIQTYEKGVFYQMTLAMLRSMEGFKNYIASCGCDLPFDAKPENMLEFFAAVRDFYAEAA